MFNMGMNRVSVRPNCLCGIIAISLILFACYDVFSRNEHLSQKYPPGDTFFMRSWARAKIAMSYVFRSVPKNTLVFDPSSVDVPMTISDGWIHNITYFLSPPYKACASSPTFLVVILSKPENFQQRVAIRKTWGNITNVHLERNSSDGTEASASYVFLLGRVENSTTQDGIVEEYNQYADIVQGDYWESFKNISYKCALGLKFASDYCRQAEFLVKVDDDVFINPYILFSLAPYGQKRVMSGAVNHISTVQREGKWAASVEEYSGTKYPPYMNGPVFMISMDVVPQLFDLAMRTKFFVIDDVYFTGMLAGKLHIRLLNSLEGMYQRTLQYELSKTCDVMREAGYHQVKVQQQYHIWNYLQESRQSKKTRCPFQ